MKILPSLAIGAMMVTATAAVAQGYDPYGRHQQVRQSVQHPTAELRISQLEEQIREQQGVIERLEYELRQLQEKMALMDKDMQMRFDDLKNAQYTPQQGGVESMGQAGQQGEAPQEPVNTANYPFSSSREHYQHAFTLLNRGKFLEARAALNDFTSMYPNDPLHGNALYWMGETYYVERDYLQAADYFRRGYQFFPKGPKATDNLLKLSMSLAAMGEKENACVILGQLGAEYPDMGVSIKQKWSAEKRRLGCQ